MMKISLPYHLWVSANKKVPMNINWYRNAHHMELSKAKNLFKDEVMAAVVDAGIHIPTFKLTPPLRLVYTLYPKNKQRMDVSNVCAIVQKFTDDSLVDLGFIDDDDYHVIRESVYRFGMVDPEKPRVELEIDEFRGDLNTERQGRFDFTD